MKLPTQLLRTNAVQRTFASFAFAAIAAVPSAAANRAPRLHAASHAPEHLIATRSAALAAHGHRASHAEVIETRGRRHSKKPSSRDYVEPATAHGRKDRSKHREPDYVDSPVVMHRASAHHRPLTKRERQEEAARERAEQLAEARYQTAHRATAKHAMQQPARVEQIAIPHESPMIDTRYASREYTASYDNATRAVEKTSRPNIYQRQGETTQIGTALRTTPDNPSREPAVDPVAEKARRSSVVVRQPAEPAKISASEAAVSSGQQFQSRVATGFGAEVTPLPRAAQRGSMEARALANEAQDLGEDLALNGVPSARTLADDAMQPLVTPMYNRDGNLLVPAPLRGSHEILVHQNMMADHDGLERIHDDYQLNRLIAQRALVSFPESASLRVNEGLPGNRRYARQWTVQFAADAARAFYQRFGEPLQINSAVRTVAYQMRLQRVNGNAAATRGEGASPHLTGQAIDFAKRGLSADQLAWMRTYLLPFIDAGKIDVEEEFQQACFHVSVYRSYLPTPRRPAIQVAQIHPLPATAATVLPESVDAER